MKLRIAYQAASDHAREVRDYRRDYERRTGRELEVIDPESVEGADLCRLYDIVEYPTLIATADDGSLQHQWRGRPLPLIDEVSYYAQ